MPSLDKYPCENENNKTQTASQKNQIVVLALGIAN